jgi:hypothetical protein
VAEAAVEAVAALPPAVAVVMPWPWLHPVAMPEQVEQLSTPLPPLYSPATWNKQTSQKCHHTNRRHGGNPNQFMMMMMMMMPAW